LKNIFKLNVSQLVAEFIIVVVGVAVALAADNWRQEFSDRDLEQLNVEQLVVDLNNGNRSLKGQQTYLNRARVGAMQLLSQLDSPSNPLDLDSVVTNFASSAQIGGRSETFRHNNTYLGLTSTGRLQLIKDLEIISAIISYYVDHDFLAEVRDDLDSTLLENFRRLTGTGPVLFMDRYDSVSPEQLTRLFDEIITNSTLQGDLKLLVARLEFLDIMLNRVITENIGLIAVLESYHQQL
jgi:hypothetical protein